MLSILSPLQEATPVKSWCIIRLGNPGSPQIALATKQLSLFLSSVALQTQEKLTNQEFISIH